MVVEGCGLVSLINNGTSPDARHKVPGKSATSFIKSDEQRGPPIREDVARQNLRHQVRQIIVPLKNSRVMHVVENVRSQPHVVRSCWRRKIPKEDTSASIARIVTRIHNPRTTSRTIVNVRVLHERIVIIIVMAPVIAAASMIAFHVRPPRKTRSLQTVHNVRSVHRARRLNAPRPILATRSHPNVVRHARMSKSRV